MVQIRHIMADIKHFAVLDKLFFKQISNFFSPFTGIIQVMSHDSCDGFSVVELS